MFPDFFKGREITGNCPFPHPICKLDSINFLADFPSVLHPHRGSPQEASSTLQALGTLTCDKTLWPERNCCHQGLLETGRTWAPNQPSLVACTVLKVPAHIWGYLGAMAHRPAPKSFLGHPNCRDKTSGTFRQKRQRYFNPYGLLHKACSYTVL